MTNRVSITIAALLFLVALPIRAQNPDSTRMQAVRAAFDSLVTANTYHLQLKNDSLHGSGVEWLVERARTAHHFMIGERHGTAEIPAVAGALYERLKPVGYDYAALEIGPFAARHVNATLDRGGIPALTAFLTQYDDVPIAFLDAREEARLTARIATAGGTIWGLDQEFVSSLPMHLDALAEQAATERERTAVSAIRSKMREQWTEGHDYLGNADPDALRMLRSAFENRGDEDVLARIDAMITSNEIYAPYTRDTGSFYYSGIQRENYMKRTLVEHVRRAEQHAGAAPRIFYKFGGLHSGQHPGADLDPRISLGTFVSEWARTVRGEDSFHMLVDCNGGRNQGSGQGPGGECTPFITGAPKGTTAPFADAFAETGITIIDLTALRAHFSDWNFLSKRAKTMILAVDAYMTVADVSPSTLFAEPEPGNETDN